MVKPNWQVVAVCIATTVVLSVAALRGAVAWHVPVWFALGVMCPAVGLHPRISSGSSDPPEAP